MKKFLGLLFALLFTVGVYAQAPQYGRYYKTLTQSGVPTQSCTDGTMIFDYTGKVDYTCRSNVWYRTALPRLSSTTSAYAVDLYGLTASTADVRFTSGATLGKLEDGTTTYLNNFKPVSRPTGGFSTYVYYMGLTDNGGSSSGLMTGGAAQKTYGFYVSLNRPSGSAATGDSNDAAIKSSYSNYAANDGNFIQRGINSTASNRSGGTLGQLVGGLVSASSKSGSTTPVVRGMEIGVDNFGTNATEHGALDLTVKNEGAKAALEYGVRVRNLNNSVGGTSGAAYLVAEPTLANTGWDYLFDANGVEVGTADFRFSNGMTLAKYSSNNYDGLKLTKSLTAGMPTAGNESTALSVENNRSGVDDEAVNTIITGIEGVVRARGPARNATFRGGHFRVYIDESYAGADALTSVGLDASVRASGAVVPHAGTAFVGVRAYMAPGFTSMVDVTNNHAFWAYNEHATNAVTNAFYASSAAGGFTNGLNLSGATMPVGGCQVKMSNGACIYVGAQTTRAAVRAEVTDTNTTIGSVYLSTAGKMYLKVAHVPGDTDWERVTTSAAD